MLAVPVHNVDRAFGFGRQLQFLFLKFGRAQSVLQRFARLKNRSTFFYGSRAGLVVRIQSVSITLF